MTANVMLVRCTSHKKLFGVRVEERNGDWVRTWAFPIDEARAKHEGFDKTEISGSFDATPEYPGCPFCKKDFLLKCTCGKLICCEWNEENDKSDKSESTEKREKASVCCEWCGAVTEEISYSEKVSVGTGDYQLWLNKNLYGF